MLETLTKEHWSLYIGDLFRLENAKSEVVDLTLDKVSGFGQRQGAVREAYSLLFTGPMNPVFQQGIFTINHRGMGTLDIFLVPIGPDSKGMRYEAIFT